MALEIVKTKSGRVFLKSQITIENKKQREMELAKVDEEVVDYTFDPLTVIGWHKSEYEDGDGWNRTWVDFQQGKGISIDCTVKQFEEIFFTL